MTKARLTETSLLCWIGVSATILAQKRLLVAPCGPLQVKYKQAGLLTGSRGQCEATGCDAPEILISVTYIDINIQTPKSSSDRFIRQELLTVTLLTPRCLGTQGTELLLPEQTLIAARVEDHTTGKGNPVQ